MSYIVLIKSEKSLLIYVLIINENGSSILEIKIRKSSLVMYRSTKNKTIQLLFFTCSLRMLEPTESILSLFYNSTTFRCLGLLEMAG
jgi:hypothetical protein